MGAAYRVTVVEPERLSLAGHMIAGLLRRSVADERRARKASRVRGEVAVDAGGMKLCLEFADGEVRVRGGEARRPRASVRAPLDALLDAALGRGMVGNVLRGRVRIGGNPFVLLRLIGLMRVR